VSFWRGSQATPAGALADLQASVEAIASAPWAPLAVLALYLIRPLLLLPITFVNLSAGFVLGAPAGLALGVVGTLASATVGYALGRLLGPASLARSLAQRWPILTTLERRGFESVAAGGFMYLHADAVNLPAGLMRLRYPVFLAGIAVGNALTMTSVVLAGSSIEGSLQGARVSIDLRTFAVALGLFATSIALAAIMRRVRR
jgi:uncharacterized membrane protein YdjX (TVP38/TMEM64 family)